MLPFKLNTPIVTKLWNVSLFKDNIRHSPECMLAVKELQRLIREGKQEEILNAIMASLPED